ncbi:NAD(P)-dependent oxidoreductase [Bordetella petrii]|uniref:NAD(P)-dependent oxidoreductase n=1 Tax=Bordetella petrii TaxID=94624 RepID=UPI001E603A2D|nr:NAD(P)-dependent oxidoreductase [Bordetella petrii]MCD0503710.1 SAM-dependent methyltransferase [Bordetella petrii]
MEFLPLFHALHGRAVLLVGGGEVALRKARLLYSAGARLRIVAPRVLPALQPLATELHQRPYTNADLDGIALAVAATNLRPLNAAVSAQAQSRGIPVNVVDAPDLCSVVFPAVVDRSPLTIAVSSGGQAPVLARLVRARLETWLPARYGDLAGLAGRFRAAVQARRPRLQQRRIFWEETFQGPVAEAVFAGNMPLAQRLLEQQLANAAPPAAGQVYWVDACAGDPDLLTFRALRLMQQAERVLHDPGVAPAILALCRRDADLAPLNSGSAPALALQLAKFAQQGRRVLVLRAGDSPAALHAAAIDALAARGIPYQVVPGVPCMPTPGATGSGCLHHPPP